MKTLNANQTLPPRESINSAQHPVIKHRYTLVTPMIERAISEVVYWIKNGVTGGAIIGASRLGKSKMKILLIAALGHFFRRIPVICLTANQHDSPSENVFFGDLLRAMRHLMANSGSAARKRERLTEAIVGLAASAGHDQVILIIDQAHRLNERQFEWLVDLHEDLNERGVELFVLLMGEPTLATLCDEFRRKCKTQIIGRFMMGRISFCGIRKKTDLHACLRNYDDRSKFPEDTDWTFSRYFLPEAFEKGWRLSQHSGVFWSAFEEVFRGIARPGAIEIPMQFFVRAVDRFLIEAHAVGDPSAISYAQIVQFIRDTKIEEVLRGTVSAREIDLDNEDPNDGAVEVPKGQSSGGTAK